MEEAVSRKYSDGIVRGKEEARNALEEELCQERMTWAAEKKGLAKSLGSYKERAKVWDLQSEALDKEIQEKKEKNKTFEEKAAKLKEEVEEGVGRVTRLREEMRRLEIEHEKELESALKESSER